MKVNAAKWRNAPLLAQLAWFIRLRWVAGVVVILGSYAEAHWLTWYPSWPRGFVVGVFVVAYNAALLGVVRKAQGRQNNRGLLLALGCVQILLDMACLTCLTLWTGGINSPLRGFFVFHMVFASLLLPQAMAYASAGGAVILLGSGLMVSGQWAHLGREPRLEFAGWALMLLLTVYLANHITRNLRQQRWRLVKQNRDMRKLARQLRRHQRAMVQHEKMVAMGQMVSGITHEIANPLASMDSLLQLIQRRPEKMRPDAVTTLREQIARIGQIIQQMKSFSHPLDMQRMRLPLNDVIDRAIEMVGFDRRIKRIKVERQYSDQVGELDVAPQALEQVMVNLIINALDAMEESASATLTIKTGRRENWAVVEVADTGYGIRAEHMARIFEPFFTTKPVGKGTGLGLSISYGLMETMGGSITVKSQAGRGTVFTIRLPIDSREREGAKQGIVATEKQGL